MMKETENKLKNGKIHHAYENKWKDIPWLSNGKILLKYAAKSNLDSTQSQPQVGFGFPVGVDNLNS